MKVLLKRDVYLLVNGKTVEALAGEAEIDEKQAGKLITRGIAEKLEAKPEPKPEAKKAKK